MQKKYGYKENSTNSTIKNMLSYYKLNYKENKYKRFLLYKACLFHSFLEFNQSVTNTQPRQAQAYNIYVNDDCGVYPV